MNINQEKLQTSLQPAFDLLNKIATERKKGCCRVCEVLALNPTILRILEEREKEDFDKPFSSLLASVSYIVQESAFKRTIADWPFENFWENPHEPRHSKLLGYFINPEEKHGYGIVLLRALFSECGLDLIVDRKCIVACEVPSNENGRIDILVTRKALDDNGTGSNNNYAVIFENKVNGAGDQHCNSNTAGQLDGYVQEIMGPDYAYSASNIHVFYMPLRSDKDPQREDKEAIIKKGVNYKKITFETEIRKWLNTVQPIENESDAVLESANGMRDNLTHYNNLITYLVNKKKESDMNHEIIEQLKNIESRGEKLPSLADALRAKTAVDELIPCLQILSSLKSINTELLKRFQTEIQMKYPLPPGEAVGLKVSGMEVTLWFGFDFEEDDWFFCCQFIDEKTIQCLEAFDKKWLWRGVPGFTFTWASDVVVGGLDYGLSEPTVQIIAKTLFSWRDHLIEKQKMTLP